MASGAALRLYFVFWIIPKGLPALVQTQQAVIAAVGDEAYLNCQLIQSRNVLQVTWQKVEPWGDTDLATCNKYFGQNVNPEFRDKVEVKSAGLQNSSIVMKKVMEQDEGCYRCLFNTYPDGAFTGRTCLTVYELHDPALRVSAEEPVVSCSATGRPAPTVTLTVARRHLRLLNHSTVSVDNADGTVTVNATATLSGVPDGSTRVGCAARVLSSQKQVFMMIPEAEEKTISVDEIFADVWLLYYGVAAVSGVIISGAVIIVLYMLKHSKSTSQGDSEGSKTLPRATDCQDPNTFNEACERAGEVIVEYQEKTSAHPSKPVALSVKESVSIKELKALHNVHPLSSDPRDDYSQTF